MSAVKPPRRIVCKTCKTWMHLGALGGAVRWVHSPGQGARCQKIKANRAALAKAKELS